MCSGCSGDYEYDDTPEETMKTIVEYGILINQKKDAEGRITSFMDGYTHGDPLQTAWEGELELPSIEESPVNISHLDLCEHNGTSKDELMQQLSAAHHALIVAEKFLHQTAPHGRDYQTMPEGTYTRAREDYEKRVMMLIRVRDEILDIALTVDQQGN
jgi:hypothetical protein